MSIHTTVINDTHSQFTETEYLLQYNEQTNDIKINFALCLRYYYFASSSGKSIKKERKRNCQSHKFLCFTL